LQHFHKGCRASGLGDLRGDLRTFLFATAGDDDLRARFCKGRRRSFLHGRQNLTRAGHKPRFVNMIRIAANSFAFSHYRLNSANHVVSDSIATIGFIVPAQTTLRASTSQRNISWIFVFSSSA
jgi:hypothetical protein